MAQDVRKTSITIKTVLTVALLGSVAVPTIAQEAAPKGADWPQWRGPAHNGISTETDWSLTGKDEPLWTKELGFGHSSFSISGGHVYTLGYDLDAGLDRVFCFDAASGEEIWQHSYPSEFWDNLHDGGTLTTPTVVGDAVYTSNREGKLFCLDAKTGDERWSHDLRKEFGLKPPRWGFAASPLVVDDRVYINLGKLIAFDRATGERVWMTDNNRGTAYSTPAAFERDGRSLLASFCGDGLAIIDQADGKEVAFYTFGNGLKISPATPVIIDDRIFVSTGYNLGCTMLRFDGNTLTEEWSSKVMRNKMTGCILWEDHLYGFDESMLKCLDLDGNELWRKRGLGMGSLSMVNERLVILSGKGEVIVAEANSDEYVELSRLKALSGGVYWSTPVLSHGRVYCRNSLGGMACLDFRRTDAGDGAGSN